MPDVPWRASAGGLTLVVRLTPKGGRDAIDGVELMSDGRPVLKVRVRAAPEDGKANAALVELIAKSLKLPKSAATVAAGHTSRVKTIEISGDPAPLSERLAALCV